MKIRADSVIGALLVLIITAAPVAAHGDVVIVERLLELAPRTAQDFSGELHYHRLVGVITSDTDVSVRFARSADDVAAIELGAAREIRLNTLIRCCDDRTWTPYLLTLRNDTDRPARVRADVRLVHDDLAVMAYQAEAGTRESVLIIGGIWLALLWTVRRRPRRPLRPAAIAFAVLATGVVALALYGAARYGGGGPAALVAVLFDVPVLPVNPIVSRAAVLLLVMGVAWSWILARWAASDRGRAHALVGVALLASVVASAVAITASYGEAGMPIAFTVAATLPIALATAVRYRRAPAR